MWIFMNDAMLSVVAHTEKPAHLLVRARLPGAIEAVFHDAKVKVTPSADYRFRAVVPRADVARVVSDRLMSIDYPNFKNSVDARTGSGRYISALHRVWRIMFDAQESVR